MLRKKILAVAVAAVAGVAAVSLAACGSSKSKSLSTQICEKADACNYLAGVSVAECVSVLNLCEAQLTAQLRADFETLSKNCLSLQACSSWASCQPTIVSGGASCWP